VKIQKIANNSATTEAIEKISTYFLGILDVSLSEFKSNQNLLYKISQ
jgi:hypothetical protein